MAKLLAALLSALYFTVESISRLIVAVFTALPLPHHKTSPRSSLTAENEPGIHTRRASDNTLPYIVLPENLFEMLQHGHELSGNGPCLGYRSSRKSKYQWLAYQDLIDRSVNFGAGLMTLGGKSGCEYLIGIFAKSSVEWTVAEYGCYAYGMATAPLYDSLGPEACQQTVKNCEIEIMVCGDDEQVHTLLDGDNFPNRLHTVITVEQLSGNRVAEIEKLGLKVLTIAQVEEIGKVNPRPLALAPTDSLASLIFTSGTTGPPKGAMLSHAHFLLELKSFMQSTNPIRLTTDDTALAIFPLAHILGRVLNMVVLVHGGKVAFMSGDINGMLSDAQELKPTFFVFVPRLMNRLYDQIHVDMKSSWFGRLVGPIAYAAKFRDMKRGIFTNQSIWDKLIFRKYQKLLGGRLRMGMIGSAAADGNILNFTRAALGCYIFEMYGQTEAGGAITSTRYGDCTTGHVGIPFVDVEIKLVDVPEMGYFAKEQRGEICSRSNFMMKGYYKMPGKTAEALDEDGWLHTGDIGMWTEEGKLKVFDRKKHIFKLSQGEYLAPERLENIFSRSDYHTNIFIDGDSKYPYCVALVYPNYEALGVSREKATRLANGRRSAHEDFIREKILEDLVRFGKEAKLKSYEIPKKISILEEPFSLENNCLTPSQKTRREVVRTLYRDQINKMYAD
ncbi:Long-chain-fatty-acid--CoA ligase 5 [Hypsibius exemplaris]|uniref:long-chain-fatty-acid--CoA ligase n=1 Tax=Hypsibius exemplaris TaxID=2072580 RepID=A0A1W0X1M9_HYPEX|nr:Long-chain-fatty-acid--CoA ligase 5 [Hypsibius exemplaris]